MKHSLFRFIYIVFFVIAGGVVAFFLREGYNAHKERLELLEGKVSFPISQEPNLKGINISSGTSQGDTVAGVVFAPDGETLAVKVISGGVDKLCLLNLRDRKLREVLSLGKGVCLDNIQWLPNGEGIVFVQIKKSKSPEEEERQADAYYFDLHRGTCNLLVNDVARLRISPNGSAFCYFTMPREERIERMKGGIIWEEWGNPRNKKEFLKKWSVLDFNWSPDGKRIAALLFSKISSPVEEKVRYALVDVGTGKERIIDSTLREPPLLAPAFLGQDKVLYLKREKFIVKGVQPITLPNPFGPLGPPLHLRPIGRKFSIVTYDITTGRKYSLWSTKLVPLLVKNGSSDSGYPVDFLPAPNGKALAIVLKRADDSRYVRLLGIEGSKVKVLKDFPRKPLFSMAWKPNGEILAVVSGGHLYLLSVRGEIEQLL